MIHLDSWLQVFGRSGKPNSVYFKVRAAMFGSVLDGVWRLRNKMVFEKKLLNLDVLCWEIALDFKIRIKRKLRKQLNRFVLSVLRNLDKV